MTKGHVFPEIDRSAGTVGQRPRQKHGNVTYENNDTNFSRLPPIHSTHDKPSWARQEYLYRIEELKQYVADKERYSRTLDDRYLHNQQLTDHVKDTFRRDFTKIEKTREETTSLIREKEGYKLEAQYYSSMLPQVEDRFLVERGQNDDLRAKKRQYQNQLAYQWKKQITEGIGEEALKAYNTAKMQFETEKERRINLLKKENWYNTEIAAIKELAKIRCVNEPFLNSKHEVILSGHDKSNTQESNLLLDIHPNTDCTQQWLDSPDDQENDTHHNRSGFNLVPHPPEAAKVNKRHFQRRLKLRQ